MRRRSCPSSIQKRIKSPLNEPMMIDEGVSRKDFKLTSEDKKDFKFIIKQVRKMSNVELARLLESDDDFILDCLLDQMPMIKTLQNEKEDLESKIKDLANFNYAREPEFVRDRLNLRETLEDVRSLRRKITCKHLKVILDKFDFAQNKFTKDAINSEEKSESIALDFLDGKMSLEEFIQNYIQIRKETSKKRTLSDKLAKDKAEFVGNITGPFESDYPVPTPRQRKRVSFGK